jgi:hypothetical protein
MNTDLGRVFLIAVVTAGVSLLMKESYQTTPWLAAKLMRWSVRFRYRDNPERATIRGEELISLLQERPTLFKLPTAVGFLLCALAYRLVNRCAYRVSAAIRRLTARWPLWIITLIAELVFGVFPFTAGLLKLPASTASMILAVIFGCIGVIILALLVWSLVWDWQVRQRSRDQVEPSYVVLVSYPDGQSYAEVLNNLSGGPWRSRPVAREPKR